jgi:hypothetical protein
MAITAFLPKSRSAVPWRKVFLGLGLGGAAVASAAFGIKRLRIRRRGNLPATLRNPPEAKPQPFPQDWSAAGAPQENLVPSAYSIPDPEAALAQAAAAAPEAPTELWVPFLRKVMERKPLQAGYDKAAWTAPLLAHYLEKVHGHAVPLFRIRAALKDMGYQWKVSRYVLTRDAQPQTE